MISIRRIETGNSQQPIAVPVTTVDLFPKGLIRNNGRNFEFRVNSKPEHFMRSGLIEAEVFSRAYEIALQMEYTPAQHELFLMWSAATGIAEVNKDTISMANHPAIIMMERWPLIGQLVSLAASSARNRDQASEQLTKRARRIETLTQLKPNLTHGELLYSVNNQNLQNPFLTDKQAKQLIGPTRGVRSLARDLYEQTRTLGNNTAAIREVVKTRIQQTKKD